MNKEITTAKIAIFRKREIRKTIHKNEWWFVIVDVVAALTDSAQPDGYIKDMRRRDPELSKGWGQIATPLSVKTPGASKSLIAPIRKASFVLFSPFRPLRLSLLSDGWLGLVMSGSRRSRIQSLPQREQELYIRQKGIAMNGLRNGCAELLSEKS